MDEPYSLTYGKRPTTVLTFRFTGDDLDPKQITELLGVTPTRAWAKGEVNPKTKGRGRYTFGCWALEPACSRCDEFEIQLNVLLEQLENLPPVFQELAEKYDTCINVGYSSGEHNFGFALERESIERLAKLKLSLDFDLYATKYGSAKDEQDEETK